MAHTLFKLRSKVFNTPQLMNLSDFEGVVEYLNNRCSDSDMRSDREGSYSIDDRLSYNRDVQVAVINLEGPTTYKPTMWAALCGGFDYQTLKEDFTYLAQQGAKTVAFHMDSPGGEAHQMMDTANYLRKTADEYGITILTYVDGLAASAGYGIAAISDRVIMSSDSEVGSIGVVVRLMNDSKALEKQGYQRTFITAGKSKVPFDSNGEFTKDFIDDLQAKVDSLYVEFTEHVAKHRNMSVETVRSTEAKTFLASDAIELGLADSVMTVEQFYTYLADTAQQAKGNPMIKNKLFLKQEDNTDMTQLAQLQEQVATLEASLKEAQAVSAQLEEVTQQLVTLQEQVTVKEQALTEAVAMVEALTSEKETMKMQSRKEKLSAVMPAKDVEAVATSLAGLEDSAFDVVLKSYAVQVEKTEASDLFVEVGATVGEEDVVQVDLTEQILKQRLGA